MLAFASELPLGGLDELRDPSTSETRTPQQDFHENALAHLENFKPAVVTQKYVNVLQTYQDCKEKQIADAPKDTKLEDKQKWRDEGNAAIDTAKAQADIYAAQMKAFKARQQ